MFLLMDSPFVAHKARIENRRWNQEPENMIEDCWRAGAPLPIWLPARSNRSNRCTVLPPNKIGQTAQHAASQLHTHRHGGYSWMCYLVGGPAKCNHKSRKFCVRIVVRRNNARHTTQVASFRHVNQIGRKR